MIHIKTEEQIGLMREAALLVSKTLTEVAKIIKPGMTTLDIDQFCMNYVKDHKATLSFYNYHKQMMRPLCCRQQPKYFFLTIDHIYIMDN